MRLLPLALVLMSTLTSLLAPVVTGASGSMDGAIGSRIGFQAHSYNDMRSWRKPFPLWFPPPEYQNIKLVGCS